MVYKIDYWDIPNSGYEHVGFVEFSDAIKEQIGEGLLCSKHNGKTIKQIYISANESISKADIISYLNVISEFAEFISFSKLK
ncbi:MAG: hypothetical protein ACOC2U_04520 [bacterium]